MTQIKTPVRPLMHDFLNAPMTGEEIERRSFEIIDSQMKNAPFSPDEWQVVRRLLHTTADFGIAENVRFSKDAISEGIKALRSGAPIFADSNMIRSGLSLARLRQVCSAYEAESIVCYVADEEVARQSRETGLPRSLHAVRKARPVLDGAIAVFGNAPVALLELNRLIMEEGLKPALVIGMPVGFVHVIESKDELMTLAVPFIAINGRRGGSPLAVAAIHALCSLATEKQM